MVDSKKIMFKLPELPYPYEALEPWIDRQTMEIHHSKHHAGYVNNLNSAIEQYPKLQKETLESLLINPEKIPKKIREMVRNNGGGHFNHSLFWQIMKPQGGGEPKGELKKAIKKNFGSFQAFKELFSKTALSHFGSGWAWLSLRKRGKLIIHSLPNQDSPLTEGLKPIMGLDVWEHAYYLKYQNRRGEYIQNWWNVVNWQKVEENYLSYLSNKK